MNIRSAAIFLFVILFSALAIVYTQLDEAVLVGVFFLLAFVAAIGGLLFEKWSSKSGSSASRFRNKPQKQLNRT